MAFVRFGDVVKEVKINIDRSTDDHEFYIAGEHMDSENIHLTKRGRFEGSDVGPAFIRLFKPGQVLYGSRRTYLKKVAVADFEGITSNTTFVLETKSEDVLLQGLLPYIMLTDSFTDYAIKNSKGSTNPYILFSDLAEYQFELPDIQTQKGILRIIQACDETKESYKTLIAATDNLVKSQFIEMFGDGVSLKSNYQAASLAAIFEKPQGGEWGEDDADGNGTPVLRTTNFTDEGVIDYSDVAMRIIALDKVKKKSLQSGDILIEKSGGSIDKPVGRVVFFDEISGKYLNNNFTARLHLNGEYELEPKFVFYFLFANYWAGGTQLYEGKTTGIHNLRLTDYLQNTEIPLPPVDIQKRFLRTLEQSDKSKFAVLKISNRNLSRCLPIRQKVNLMMLRS